MSQPETGRAPSNRGERTRAAVVEALIQAFSEGEPRPTARSLAERAGVSLRSIYVHFADLDEVRLEVARTQHRRISATLPALDPEAPLDERIAGLMAAFEELYPSQRLTRLVALLDAFESPALDEFMREQERAYRSYLLAVFHVELGTDRDRLAAVEALTSAAFRHLLVERQGLGPAEASAVVGDLLRGALTRRC